jgi:hypothetical protein
MDLREEKEIEDIERVAYDNDLTDEYILRDFHTLDFRQVTIDEIKFYFSGNRLHWFSSLIKENLLIDTSNNPISEDKLKQYLKEYGKGFREGYFKYLEGYFKYLDKTNEGIYFDTKEIILFKKENKIYINKIYSKVYKPTNLSCLPLESISMENNSKEIYKIIEDDLFNFGVIDGEIYKAWIIISKYNSMFIKKWDNEKFIEEQIENNLITENLNIDSRDTDENKTSQHNKLIWQGTQTESVSISNNYKDLDIVEAIEDHVFEFTDNLKKESYNLLTGALYTFFVKDKFPELTKKIKFNSINKKRVGWALNCIFNELKPNDNLSLDYLIFAKNNINLFEETKFDKKNYLKSNLYKYFTQKP